MPISSRLSALRSITPTLWMFGSVCANWADSIGWRHATKKWLRIWNRKGGGLLSFWAWPGIQTKASTIQFRNPGLSFHRRITLPTNPSTLAPSADGKTTLRPLNLSRLGWPPTAGFLDTSSTKPGLTPSPSPQRLKGRCPVPATRPESGGRQHTRFFCRPVPDRADERRETRQNLEKTPMTLSDLPRYSAYFPFVPSQTASSRWKYVPAGGTCRIRPISAWV